MQAGPPVKDSPASQESSYCHALVHRKEGEYDGELGLTGWSNSCFWFKTTGQHRQDFDTEISSGVILN